MKKAIKKTCVVLLLFALLVSQVAASYSETGTLNEGTSAISAAERYLSNWAYNSYMYADKNLTLGTVLDAEVDPAIGLFVHNRILLKNVPTAQAASSSVRFICRKRAGDIVITLYPISSSFVARS